MFSDLQVICPQDESSRAVDLERSINLGKSQRDSIDRDMQEDWVELHRLKQEYEDRFDELVCSEPDELAALLAGIEKLADEVSKQMIMFPIFISNCTNVFS